MCKFIYCIIYRNVDIIIGIDEAGRGPVLGSLIYCAAFWPSSESEEINKLGFNDSKQLKEEERLGLLKKMIAHPSIGWVVEELTAEFISEVSINDMITSVDIRMISMH
jgi:ribonuclease H2 subunit A